MSSIHRLLALIIALAGASAVLSQPVLQTAAAQAPSTASSPALSRADQEAFLLRARIVGKESVSKGITGTWRVTLSDDTMTHDASVQTIDDRRTQYQTLRGTEINFRDSWQFNVAAYRLDKLLDLGMIPATVAREFEGKEGAFTWWVDDLLMDESERIKKKIRPPNVALWNQQMWTLRVFDQLIYNTDRNLGNLLIDQTWKIWMIDHSRAFRWHDELAAPKNLTRCDRQLLEKMRGLDEATLQRDLGEFLGPNEIEGLLARRDLIVAHFERGGRATLYDAKR